MPNPVTRRSIIDHFQPADITFSDLTSVLSRASRPATAKTAMLLAFLMLFSSSVNAACKGVNCVCVPSEIAFKSPTSKPNADGKYPISLEADDVESQGQEVVTLVGNAEVAQGRRTIVADKIQYYRETERVVADGNVEIVTEEGSYLSSDSIDVHAPTQIGQLINSKFKMASGITSENGIDTVQLASRGSAGVVNLEGEGVMTLEDASYTTCNEGNQDVMIYSKNLELDNISGVGKARNATVRFKGVAIFYAPYLSFPLNDERKTGWLTPSFGNDEDSGNVLEFPWYWNIAKNQDATITPRFYTDRGVQLAGEYRRVSEFSNTFIYGEILPDDDLFDDDRTLLTVQHFQQFSNSITGAINYNDVSDIDYFDDLRRNDTQFFSATFVPRDIQLNYSSQYLSATIRANEYQIIDDIFNNANTPFERLPAITIATNLPDGPYGLKYNLGASYTSFVSDTRQEGDRLALTPYVELPLNNAWGYVKPRVSYHFRTYDLDDVADGVEDNPSFAVPIFSVDSGLYLEKNTSFFGKSAIQTLEPRLFYAFAPDEDQSDVPIFDTSQVSLDNVTNIFRENRFFGEDRVGDTNQLTLGLTTRFIDSETGDERLRASLGQLILLDDLEENLFGQTIESGFGDVLGEVRTELPGGWSAYSFAQYDVEESELRTARFDLGYAPKDDSRKRLSLGYYFVNRLNTDTDQVTLNLDWPIADRWQFRAQERFSIEDSESLFTQLELEYNACCWKARFTAQERITDRNIDEKRQAFFFELELTSLGSFSSGL